MTTYQHDCNNLLTRLPTNIYLLKGLALRRSNDSGISWPASLIIDSGPIDFPTMQVRVAKSVAEGDALVEDGGTRGGFLHEARNAALRLVRVPLSLSSASIQPPTQASHRHTTTGELPNCPVQHMSLHVFTCWHWRSLLEQHELRLRKRLRSCACGDVDPASLYVGIDSRQVIWHRDVRVSNANGIQRNNIILSPEFTSAIAQGEGNTYRRDEYMSEHLNCN